jgi:hypothetical protein
MPELGKTANVSWNIPLSNSPHITDTRDSKQTLPGVRCPNCATGGVEVWVFEGRLCVYCGTPC